MKMDKMFRKEIFSLCRFSDHGPDVRIRNFRRFDHDFSQLARLFESGGGLLRYEFDFLEITYGNRTEEFLNLEFQTETFSIEIPVFEGQSLKVGIQKQKISEDGKTLAEIPIVKFSLNVQFDSPFIKEDTSGGEASFCNDKSGQQFYEPLGQYINCPRKG